jgi:hypothetical protein
MCFFAIKTENKSGQTFFIYLSILMNVSAVLLTFVWFRSRYLFLSGLPGFYWSKHTKLGKIYQMTNNYSKRPYMITNGRKIFQMVIKSTYISIPRPSEIYPKLGFLVRKKHLATLVSIPLPPHNYAIRRIYRFLLAGLTCFSPQFLTTSTVYGPLGTHCRNTQHILRKKAREKRTKTDRHVKISHWISTMYVPCAKVIIYAIIFLEYALWKCIYVKFGQHHCNVLRTM